MPQSESEELRRTVERVFPSHCPFGLYTLMLCVPDNLVDLERFGTFFFTDLRPFEH